MLQVVKECERLDKFLYTCKIYTICTSTIFGNLEKNYKRHNLTKLTSKGSQGVYLTKDVPVENNLFLT